LIFRKSCRKSNSELEKAKERALEELLSRSDDSGDLKIQTFPVKGRGVVVSLSFTLFLVLQYSGLYVPVTVYIRVHLEYKIVLKQIPVYDE
jgi:hypothetical protein